MSRTGLYPDRRDEIWPGVSKGKADFLQQKWSPSQMGGSLRYKGFVFSLYSESKGQSWGGEVTGRNEQERLLPDSPMSVLDAKTALYDKMLAIIKRHKVKSEIAKRIAKRRV